MARYIDADALFMKLPDVLPYKASVKRVLMQAPTADVVEVVRCKDCKYLTTTKIAGDSVWICKNAKGMVSPDPDLYCSFGERKEDV